MKIIQLEKLPYLSEKEAEEYTQKMNDRRKTIPKTECPCGGCYLYQNKNVHLKSQKHQTYLHSEKVKNEK